MLDFLIARTVFVSTERNLLIEAVSPVVLTYSPEGLLMFGILSHTYRYKVTSWSHNLLIAHTVFDSGSLAGILQSLKPVKIVNCNLFTHGALRSS